MPAAPTLPQPPVASPRPHREWLRLIAEWQTSGLDERIYCQSIGVKLDTFRYHRYRASKEARSPRSKSPGFRALTVAPNPRPPATGVVLYTSRCRMELPVDLSMHAIAELVKAFEN